jgi:CBS domain-containing protein
MCRSTKTCRSSDSLDRAAHLMWENDCGCLPIVDDEGRGVGMITDRDICMAAYTQGRPLAHLCVGTAMAHDLRSCRATDTISEAENIMRAAQVRRLPVVDAEGHVIGLLSFNDIVREAARERATSSKPEIPAEDVAETLSAICALRGERQVAAAA